MQYTQLAEGGGGGGVSSASAGPGSAFGSASVSGRGSDSDDNGSSSHPVDSSNDHMSIRSKISTRSFRTVSVGNPELKEPLTGASHNDDDPFYVFREDLYRKLDLVDDGLAEYLRLIHHTDTAVNTHALKDAKKQLKRHIRNAESTLKDVQTTISLVETQKDRFAHIDASELYERKALVTTSNDRLGRVKSDMNSDVIKQKILADERAKAQRRMKRDDDEEHDIENTAFIADSQAHTSLLLQQQDETLDELGEAVTRVGQMAENIHQEIGYQNKMLTDMEDDLADAEEKLGLVMGKLAKFLKTKDKWQLGTILMLTLVALILFFLVLTT